MAAFFQTIDNISSIVQWPALMIPLEKTTQWRNENPHLQRRLVATIAYLGIALGTLATSIAKFALGMITLIPPFTRIGITMLFSIPVFELQVLCGSIDATIKSLFKRQLPSFELCLI